MSDYEDLCNAVCRELFDPDLNPEDVYDMAAMYADDEPGLRLRDLMRANIRFPERDEDNSASVLREICTQEGIKTQGASYDEIISDIANIYSKARYILERAK